MALNSRNWFPKFKRTTSAVDRAGATRQVVGDSQTQWRFARVWRDSLIQPTSSLTEKLENTANPLARLTLFGDFPILAVRVFHEIFRRLHNMSTYFPSGKGLEQHRQWHVVDADGKTIGRLASEVAQVLMGKHKPTYTPFIDMGDHVIVINAAKIVLKGNKLDDKVYHHHTGFPGGLKSETARKRLARRPVKMVEDAIRGMLPKTKLG